jgi:anti-anti-sigma regulatory factor
VTTFLAHGVEGDELGGAEERTDRRRTRDGCRTFAVTEVSSAQRCVTVALHGELNATTALVLFGQLAFFCVCDPSEMVADMGDVTAIDDDGVTALIDARQALRLRYCDLSIRATSADLHHLLETAGFRNLVER